MGTFNKSANDLRVRDLLEMEGSLWEVRGARPPIRCSRELNAHCRFAKLLTLSPGKEEHLYRCVHFLLHASASGKSRMCAG